MIGILLITHNGLGDSLLDCVQHVMGKAPSNLRALSVQADDDLQHKEGEGRALIAQLDTGDGVLLLVDIYGATPCNIARRLYQPGRVEAVSGVNLPMLLSVVCYSGKPLAETVEKALKSGRECITLMDLDLKGCNAATRCSDY